jgi:DNA-binding transcriptional regulator YiaG
MVKFAQLTDFELLKKQRGNRVRILRTALRLSRRAFAEKYGIPRGTLQNWEDGRYGGLTEKGAMQLLEIMRQEGLYCTVEWLLHGMGDAPQIAKVYDTIMVNPIKIQDKPLEQLTYQEMAFMSEELTLYRKHYQPHVIDLCLPDNKMAPKYKQGDIVAGRKRYQKDIAKLIGQVCIVQLSDGQILVRELQASHRANCYQISYFNSEQAGKLEMQEVELICAASISWHRCRDLFQYS